MRTYLVNLPCALLTAEDEEHAIEQFLDAYGLELVYKDRADFFVEDTAKFIVEEDA